MMSAIPASANPGAPASTTPAFTGSPALLRCGKLIAADPVLAASLSRCHLAEDLLERLSETSALHGIALGEDDRKTVLENRALPLGPTLTDWNLSARHGWLPIALEFGVNGPELLWACGAALAAEPFYEQTAAALRTRPVNRLFAVHTPLTSAFIEELSGAALPLAGLIFHMSRCGSTLLAQGLKAWRGVRVVSEPALLDTAIFFARAGYDPQWLCLRGAVAALSQPCGDDSRVVLKLDAWHALAIGDVLERLHVPWVYAYRNPVEVLASHRNEPGRHTVPGMLPDEWIAPSTEFLNPGANAARVVGSICAAILPHAKRENLVNYEELPGAIGSRVAVHFRLDDRTLDTARLEATVTQHAKRPYERFSDDRTAKRATASREIYENVARWMEPHYRALEDIRTVIRCLRIPMACDLDALRVDLAAAAPAGWHPHFNQEYFSGEWSGIALRAQPNARSPLYADPTRDDFADTESMRACSYVPTLLAQFECPIESVRFLKLAPGAQIREHRDYGLRFEDGKVRFHIPVHTNPDVEFVLGGESLRLAAGECWYLNFDLGHALANRGTSDRVHLVIDASVNAWVTELFQRLRAD